MCRFVAATQSVPHIQFVTQIQSMTRMCVHGMLCGFVSRWVLSRRVRLICRFVTATQSVTHIQFVTHVQCVTHMCVR